jgi:hypothetical protein
VPLVGRRLRPAGDLQRVANNCPADAKSTSGVPLGGGRLRPGGDLRRRRTRLSGRRQEHGRSAALAAGVCDLAETCDGASNACPADAKSTAVCRSRRRLRPGGQLRRRQQHVPGGCEEHGRVPRSAAGVCDLPESCDGSQQHLSDGREEHSRVPRLGAGVCDLADAATA